MRKKSWALLMLALLLAFCFSACMGGDNSQSSSEPFDPNEVTAQTVFDALKEKFEIPDAVLTDTGPSELIYNDANLLGIENATINGEQLYLSFFRFSSKEDADEGVKAIDEDGNVWPMDLTWLDTPYFFKKDRIIGLYVGHDPQVIETITSVMGEPVVIGPEVEE